MYDPDLNPEPVASKDDPDLKCPDGFPPDAWAAWDIGTKIGYIRCMELSAKRIKGEI